MQLVDRGKVATSSIPLSLSLSLSLSHSHMNEGQAKSQALKPFDVLPELSWHQQQ